MLKRWLLAGQTIPMTALDPARRDVNGKGWKRSCRGNRCRSTKRAQPTFTDLMGGIWLEGGRVWWYLPGNKNPHIHIENSIYMFVVCSRWFCPILPCDMLCHQLLSCIVVTCLWHLWGRHLMRKASIDAEMEKDLRFCRGLLESHGWNSKPPRVMKMPGIRSLTRQLSNHQKLFVIIRWGMLVAEDKLKLDNIWQYHIALFMLQWLLRFSHSIGNYHSRSSHRHLAGCWWERCDLPKKTMKRKKPWS